jgi:hypothetical protein
MAYQFDEIVSFMRQRRTADGVLIRAMIENRDRYNGDTIVVSPSVASIPAGNRPGPNFFQESVDGLARSANASLPKINCPVMNPDDEASEKLASKRQGALYGAWYEDQIQLKLGRSFRHIGSYGTCAFTVIADDKLGRASIQIRDPLTSYPELRAPDDVRSPANCGFLFARSAQWIKAHYPDVAPAYLAEASSKGWDTLWDIVEWVDEEQIVIGVMGPRFPAYGYGDSRPYGYNAFQLGRWPNKAGMAPVVVPRRVTLDRIMGQLTAMINYSDLYADMLFLELTAVEKSTFPDLVVMSRTGMPPKLVGDVWNDGRTGLVNMVIDGSVEVIGKEPGPSTIPVLQMMDQHIRSGSGGPLMGGGNGGMRTGAGVDALGDYGVNPMAAEAQLVMQSALSEVNRAWMAVQKGYYGDTKFTCILGLAGSAKTVEYVPNRDFKETFNVVHYISPGADENKLAVAVTQLNATKMMSLKTAREMHPLIQDADEEEQFVAVESMTAATLAGFTNAVAQGQQTPAVAARATELVAGGMPSYLAIGQAIAEAAQGPGATEAPDGGAATGPNGQPMSPGLAALMASQGAGLTPKGMVPANAPPGGGPPTPEPGLMNFRHVLQGINEQSSPGAT